MKKLEEDLGIPIFERSKNKLTLNKNGEYILELAKKLLLDANSLISKARDFDCKKCTSESLMFALPKGHKYARRKSLTFWEMNGENMLLMPDIGFWSFVKDKMPNSRFLTQNDRFSFNELIQASSLPSFATDLAEKYTPSPTERIYVPISDEEATVTYYLICRAENKKLFHSLFHNMQK